MAETLPPVGGDAAQERVCGHPQNVWQARAWASSFTPAVRRFSSWQRCEGHFCEMRASASGSGHCPRRPNRPVGPGRSLRGDPLDGRGRGQTSPGSTAPAVPAEVISHPREHSGAGEGRGNLPWLPLPSMPVPPAHKILPTLHPSGIVQFTPSLLPVS